MFGRVCKATERTDFQKLAESFTTHKDLYIKTILHSREYEKEAFAKYEEMSGFKLSECGIFISKEYHSLGASQDNVVSESVVCEVKCPLKPKTKTSRILMFHIYY